MSSRRIGVVGGVGPAATILYYRLLIERAREVSPDSQPLEIVIDSLDLEEIQDLLVARELDRMGHRMARSLATLEAAGCDSVVIACNSMHLAFSQAVSAVKVPVVNIVDAVLEAARRGGYRTVGLLATTFVMQSRLYRDPLESRGVRCLEPPEPVQEWIMQAILDDLQQPVVPAPTVERLLRVVADLAARGAEAVILGCTDLPVAITEANSPIPVLDTARIHVDAVLELGFGSIRTAPLPRISRNRVEDSG